MHAKKVVSSNGEFQNPREIIQEKSTYQCWCAYDYFALEVGYINVIC